MSARKQVKVYSIPTCPWCKKVKQFLNDNGIAYEDSNVAADQAAREEMVEKTDQLGVPVTMIDGDYVVGFEEGALREKLGL
jgi:glutaredoxin-like YruB-family protein